MPAPANSLQPRGLPSSTVSIAKADLSAILKGVESKHSPVTILRRGVPVAQIIPVPNQLAPLLRGSMAGPVRIPGDIVSPLACLRA